MGNELIILIQSLKDKIAFSEAIGQGRFDQQYYPIGDQDSLGHSLVQMRSNLQTAQEQINISAQEAQKREWLNESLAEFERTIREHQENTNELCNIILPTLAKRINANQGVIYMKDDEEYFEPVSAFAWDRKKHIDKKIHQEEGLIGRCALEKESIMLTEIPEDYIKITSGLGEALPKCIFICPLLKEGVVFGIIEIASFQVLSEEAIQLIERLCDSMASSIEGIRMNQHTKKLLEQSEELTEQLSMQEEEMRQQLEELTATQEEMSRNEKQLLDRIKELEDETKD